MSGSLLEHVVFIASKINCTFLLESAKFGTPEKTFLMRSTATRFNVGLAFAEEAGNESLHAHPTKFSLERPCRASAVMDQLGSEQLVAKMKFISGEDFPRSSAAFPSMSVDEAVLLVHSKEYFQSLLECADMGETGQQQRAALSAADMYVTPSTPR
jgi:acetoin utilization deacetylase AcuC-like enzyme